MSWACTGNLNIASYPGAWPGYEANLNKYCCQQLTSNDLTHRTNRINRTDRTNRTNRTYQTYHTQVQLSTISDEEEAGDVDYPNPLIDCPILWTEVAVCRTGGYRSAIATYHLQREARDSTNHRTILWGKSEVATQRKRVHWRCPKRKFAANVGSYIHTMAIISKTVPPPQKRQSTSQVGGLRRLHMYYVLIFVVACSITVRG